MTARPWKAAVWTPQPGSRPTDVKRGTFATAWDAQKWLRKHTGPNLARQCWHETELAPADLGARPAGAAAEVATGRARRDQGVKVADAATDDWWRSCADEAIASLAATGRPFTADDVRDLGVPRTRRARRRGAPASSPPPGRAASPASATSRAAARPSTPTPSPCGRARPHRSRPHDEHPHQPRRLRLRRLQAARDQPRRAVELLRSPRGGRRPPRQP